MHSSNQTESFSPKQEKQSVSSNSAEKPSKVQYFTIDENLPDDVKSIAGPLYNAVKSTLGLTKCGNTHEAFARDTLAPLIEPGMSVYAQLKKDIFGV